MTRHPDWKTKEKIRTMPAFQQKQFLFLRKYGNNRRTGRKNGCGQFPWVNNWSVWGLRTIPMVSDSASLLIGEQCQSLTPILDNCDHNQVSFEDVSVGRGTKDEHWGERNWLRSNGVWQRHQNEAVSPCYWSKQSLVYQIVLSCCEHLKYLHPQSEKAVCMEYKNESGNFAKKEWPGTRPGCLYLLSLLAAINCFCSCNPLGQSFVHFDS